MMGIRSWKAAFTLFLAAGTGLLVLGYLSHMNARRQSLEASISSAASIPERSPISAITTTHVSEGGATLTSQSIDLPDDASQFPDGPNAAAINDNCLACHSSSMVLNQPRLSRPQWKSIVDKMRHVYKAPVSDGDAAKIVDYLEHLSADEKH
ncbi:hypothetical protein [Bradyrhizobium genosp. P]|uniref:hypothetical protein n=1 Tax=Bradyrhizobium genosp. P TaxID=83641 RepID=UPI003CF9554F